MILCRTTTRYTTQIKNPQERPCVPSVPGCIPRFRLTYFSLSYHSCFKLVAFLFKKSATFTRNIYQVNSSQYFCCSCKHLHCNRSISKRSTQTFAVFTLIFLLFLSMLMLLQISNLRKGRLHHIHPAGRFVGWLVSVTIDFRFMRFALLTLSSSCQLLMMSKCTIAPENNLLRL